MHSFAKALTTVALATLGIAAPVGLPAGLAGRAPVPADAPLALPVDTNPLNEFDPLTDTLGVRGIQSKTVVALKPIDSEIPDVRVRDAVLSIADILVNTQSEIEPSVEPLMYINDANSTVTGITTYTDAIKASITSVVPELEALIGQKESVIMASADASTGSAELTVAQVAVIVGDHVNFVLGAAGHVLEVVEAKGGDLAVEVKADLADLGVALTSLVGVVVKLVGGISASLATETAQSESVVSELGLSQLGIYLGLST